LLCFLEYSSTSKECIGTDQYSWTNTTRLVTDHQKNQNADPFDLHNTW
jgi:hypothetical protein